MTWPELLATQLRNEIMDGLVVLTRHLILRRTKEKHLPDLPAITHNYIYTTLHHETQVVYDVLHCQTATEANNLNEKVLYKEKKSFLQRITALRLLCAHPQMAEETIRSLEGAATTRKCKDTQPPKQSSSSSNSQFEFIYVQPQETGKAPKITQLIFLLQDLRKQSMKPKSVIFSEWTVFLDW